MLGDEILIIVDVALHVVVLRSGDEEDAVG